MKVNKAEIISTGSYLPARRLTNRELAARFDVTEQWIVERCGINERRVASPDESTSDLAAKAAKKALRVASCSARDLDLIIVATVSSDMPMPSTAVHVQRKIGAERAFAFDVGAACSGFLYSLVIADQFIRAGNVKKVMVVAAELLSRFVNPHNINGSILFGDGAGCAILSAGDGQSGIMDSQLYSDGNKWDLLYIPGGGTCHPATLETLEKDLHTGRMNGKELYKNAVKLLSDATQKILTDNGLNSDQLKFVIPHQANIRIINSMISRLKIDPKRVVVNLDLVGNTSAASIPIALDQLVQDGRIQKGDLLLLNAIGAGLTWGAILFRW